MKDLKHYLVLLALLVFGLVAFWFLDFNRQAQIGVILVMAATYVIWGMVHHSLKKDFHLRIVLEYLLVAGLASVVVIFLLFRA